MNWLDKLTYQASRGVNAACWVSIIGMGAVALLITTGAGQ